MCRPRLQTNVLYAISIMNVSHYCRGWVKAKTTGGLYKIYYYQLKLYTRYTFI